MRAMLTSSGKVWGKELAPVKFSEFNNCKDPTFSFDLVLMLCEGRRAFG
jgi:hypothetical protein